MVQIEKIPAKITISFHRNFSMKAEKHTNTRISGWIHYIREYDCINAINQP